MGYLLRLGVPCSPPVDELVVVRVRVIFVVHHMARASESAARKVQAEFRTYQVMLHRPRRCIVPKALFPAFQLNSISLITSA